MAVLLSRRVKGAILLGIGFGTALAWLLGVAELPATLFSLPSLPRETLLAFDFRPLATGALPVVVLAFLFVDVFDTAGTLIGVGRLGGFLDARGNLPRADRAFFADALGTTVGAALGTSTVTSYIESAAGVKEGGRTGLTAAVVALLFVLSLFFIPLLAAVPAAATAPALVLVGALMLEGARHIDWERIDEAVPAFLTIAGMPFTFSIANGISLGIVSYAAIKLLSGRWREASPVLYGVAALLVLYYAFIAGG
jgi:AGZA family xanthine/uracil permease-like MFS transporter